jgi:hypothetical protein
LKIGKPRLCFVLCALILVVLHVPGPARLSAMEIRHGLIRLDIQEYTGRFSLYYLTDPETESYEPLFTHQDPRTSFLAVNINGRTYRLGETSSFVVRVIKRETAPAIVFESPFLLVRQEFSFIKTVGSTLSNGIKMTVWVKNLAAQETVMAGLRILLDTSLGEGFGDVPFVTDTRNIQSETALTADDSDQWWISENGRLSLMGSIVAGMDRRPDFLHFANWKRLNDMPWKVGYLEGRNFNYPPYSIGDSAVSYYYEPAPLPPGETKSYAVYLAAADGGGFGFSDELSPENREADLKLLRELLSRLDQFIGGEIAINADEVADMERTISQIKARYGLP